MNYVRFMFLKYQPVVYFYLKKKRLIFTCCRILIIMGWLNDVYRNMFLENERKGFHWDEYEKLEILMILNLVWCLM